MAYSAAQNRATQKYAKKAYDRIAIVCKKGRKADYQETAKKVGKSLNKMIIDYLEEETEKMT